MGKNRDRRKPHRRNSPSIQWRRNKNPHNAQRKPELQAAREIPIHRNQTRIYQANRITLHINHEWKRIPKRIQKPKPTTQRRTKNPQRTTTQKNATGKSMPRKSTPNPDKIKHQQKSGIDRQTNTLIANIWQYQTNPKTPNANTRMRKVGPTAKQRQNQKPHFRSSGKRETGKHRKTEPNNATETQHRPRINNSSPTRTGRRGQNTLHKN